jgi:hypothetical protein
MIIKTPNKTLKLLAEFKCLILKVIKYILIAVGPIILFCTLVFGEDFSVNYTEFENPNPLIEEIHVKAYNLDLGIGVPQNREKANELYLKAAMAGDPRSMMNLAINLTEGKGIEKNLEEAFAWIDIARFYTQRSKDMKVKWSIRYVYDEMKKSLPKKLIRKGKKRGKVILEEMKN